MLTTTEAAEAAAVAPSTIKRWADQGVLPFSRTAGGHRRFERFHIERFLREQPASTSSSAPVATAWVRCLVGGRRHEIDGRLLEARGRLGCWWRVADELAVALAEMGNQWERGRLTIADVSMCGYLYWPDEFGVSWQDYPSVGAWLERIRSQPGWVHPYKLMPGHR